MAKSMCIVSFLMIFLLISTGIPKGKAQCVGVRSRTREALCDIPLSLVSNTACSVACIAEGHIRGQCGVSGVCSCYDC